MYAEWVDVVDDSGERNAADESPVEIALEALGTPLGPPAPADDAFFVMAGVTTSAHRRERLACRAQLENLKVLRQRQISAMHALERQVEDVESTRQDLYAEARAKHDALQRELAEHIADILLQVDAEEAEMLAPIRAQLDVARAAIAELERAESTLSAALRIGGADEFERAAQMARASAARAAAGVRPEPRARAPRARARFGSGELLARVRLVGSDAGGLALEPRGDEPLDGARTAGDDAVRYTSPEPERRPSAERWRRRTSTEPPAACASRFAPIWLAPRARALADLPPVTAAAAAAAAAAARHTASAACATAASYECAAGGTLHESPSPLLDHLARYRAASAALPQPVDVVTQRVIHTPPARQLRSEAQSAIALHELRALSGRAETLYEWAVHEAVGAEQRRAAEAAAAEAAVAAAADERDAPLRCYAPRSPIIPPRAAGAPRACGLLFAADAQRERWVGGVGSPARWASGGSAGGWRESASGWRESMGESRSSPMADGDGDGFSSPGGRGAGAMSSADEYADALLRQLRELEERVASQP